MYSDYSDLLSEQRCKPGGLRRSSLVEDVVERPRRTLKNRRRGSSHKSLEIRKARERARSEAARDATEETALRRDGAQGEGE